MSIEEGVVLLSRQKVKALEASGFERKLVSDSEESTGVDQPPNEPPIKTDPGGMSRQLVGSIDKFEKAFRKEYPQYWWISLLAPVLVTAALLIGFGLFSEDGWQFSGKVILNAFITFFALGRFVICYPAFIAGASGDPLLPDWLGGLEPYLDFSAGNLFWLVTYMDFMVALFVTFHMGLLFRIPWVGPKIAMLVWDGKFVMDSQPWIRKIAFWGLAIFVIFPTSTTGSIGGSIFGRLLGLSRGMTVLGVLVGSLMGNGLMLVFSEFISAYVKDSFELKIVGFVILVVAMFFLERRYRAAKERFLKNEGIDEDVATESK